jgi:uncharacterized lipoprotein NlpE involved in copper resistance
MLMYRRVTAAALAAVVLLTLVGCSKLRELQSAAKNAGKVPSISQWTADTMTQAFTAINARMGSAPKDSGVAESPSIEWLMVKKVMANDAAPRITVEVKGPRARKMLHYDMTGALLDVNQG